MRSENRLSPLWPDLGGPLGLVSTSPRRAEILKAIGVPFRLIPPAGEIEEALSGDPEEITVANARAKAESVGGSDESFLLAGDTLVVTGGETLGKPAGPAEAKRMLRLLSGRRHRVVTGLYAVNGRDGRAAGAAESTDVWFRNLSDAEIEAYVATGESLDKAGAYGIQGIGSLLVSRIDGCYFNVVGLPLTRVLGLLRELCPDSR